MLLKKRSTKELSAPVLSRNAGYKMKFGNKREKKVAKCISPK